MQRGLLLTFLLLSFFFPSSAIETFEFHDHTPPTHLNKYIEIYEDEDNSVRLEDLKGLPFQKAKEKTPNFGHTSSTIWLHFKIHNATSFTPFLRVNPEWFPEIMMYTFIKGELFDSTHFGAIFPKGERPLHISAPNTGLKVTQGQEADVYLKLESDHIILFDITVADDASHYESHSLDIVFYFIFIGVLLCVLIYNFVLSISVSRIANYYFVLYIVCLIINTSFVKGFHDLIHSPYLANHSNIFSALMVVFLAESIVHLTDLKSISKKLYYGRFVVMGPAFLSLLLNFLGEVRIANELIINFSFVGTLWGLIVGVRIFKAGDKGAIIIFSAFFSFIIGAIFHLLSLKGVLDSNIITSNSYVIGSGFQVLIFSFYLAGKLYNIRKEKYLAQKQVLLEIQKNEQLVREQNVKLEEKVKERTSQLREQNDIIKETNKRITDGITYASYIQEAHLSPLEQLKEICSDGFIFNRPKDIIGGDFYYFTEANDHLYYAVADCTGHGVPGALLSITGHSLLKEIILIDQLTDPGLILDKLNTVFYNTLHQDTTDNQDGMDITIVIKPKGENRVMFAGAKNPLLYVKDNELLKIKGDRLSIGGNLSNKKYTTQEIVFQDSFTFYLFSDGFQDQFDENDEYKFSPKRFASLLQDIQQTNFDEQQKRLEKELDSWKGSTSQTDDVLVMGIKIKS